MKRRLRWRPCTPGETATVTRRLADWPCDVGGSVRHMFALATIEAMGAGPIRLATDDDRWAAAVVFPGRIVVPCGDATAIEAAGQPTRRWRMVFADAAPVDALLAAAGPDDELRVHVQRLMVIDPALVPTERELPDPGLRVAVPDDLDGLAELAVQLHVDDQFGPHPGRSGFRGYRDRLAQTVARGLVWCVGPVGGPVLKLERSVSSPRWGVQLAGIVARPDHRGTGLGRSAVAAAVRQATRDHGASRPVSLHVRADNGPAIASYLAAGFVDREEWRLAVRP